nr:hypothetical protein [Frankia gtarii]
MDLVGDDDDTVPRGRRHKRRQLRTGVHGARRVLRIAQQIRASSPECLVEAFEVEAAVSQRHVDERGVGLGDPVVERRVDRGADHDAAHSECAQHLDGADAHVGHGHDMVGLRAPTPLPGGEVRVGVRELGEFVGVTEVAPIDRCMQRLRDGVRRGKVHLRDRQRQHIRRVHTPFGAAALAQHIERGHRKEVAHRERSATVVARVTTGKSSNSASHCAVPETGSALILGEPTDL